MVRMFWNVHTTRMIQVVPGLLSLGDEPRQCSGPSLHTVLGLRDKIVNISSHNLPFVKTQGLPFVVTL